MNNFIRESKDRTHSERLIDRHIISRYDEPELSKKAKITENASVSKSITFTEGFEKLKNNLKKKKFQTKLIQTFYKFLKAYYMKIEGSEIYLCISFIFSHDLSLIFPSSCLIEILNFIKKNELIVLDNEKAEIENWEYISNTFNLMITDDSVSFHKLLKDVEKKLDDINECNSFAVWYGKGILVLKKFLTISWSRSAMQSFIRKCYRKLQVFHENVREEIIKMLDLQAETGHSVSIPEILSKSHSISDNRSEIQANDSLDAWASKQNGL